MTEQFCDKRRILIVDDAELAREIEGLFLYHAGCTVVEAEDGVQALQKYQELRPVLVILDIIMPNLNGIQTLRQLKKVDPAVRVLICTAADDYRMIDMALKEGALGYIIKPFKGDEFLKKVHDIIGDT
ncbi:MAG TPA: response regulator [Methanospirillum sp.]|uniref:response regulator n=1 Tax=Methanospirillum sp. TaxID=45200 RepID=UPI002C7B1568|nr:response regulator [Methanospirillum sp.]HWQ65064.1 response regulator [Methanospirillum sp.]